MMRDQLVTRQPADDVGGGIHPASAPNRASALLQQLEEGAFKIDGDSTDDLMSSTQTLPTLPRIALFQSDATEGLSLRERFLKLKDEFENEAEHAEVVCTYYGYEYSQSAQHDMPLPKH